MTARRRIGLLVPWVCAWIVACAEDPAAPEPAAPTIVELTFEGLVPLDAAEGSYTVWLIDANGRIVPVGRILEPQQTAITFDSPVVEPTHIMVTVEPPGIARALPSLPRILGGRFDEDATARLGVTGYLTPVGIPLEPTPGTHILAATSPGAPADAGLWLVDPSVDSTDTGYFQMFTPLTRGWAYEGWIVRDFGGPEEIWLSYGQFLPNNLRRARFRDDTGLGPFSGYPDWERARAADIHYPGDDWVANPQGYPVPGRLALPLDLNGDAGRGVSSRWTHVITIEPVFEPDGNRMEQAWAAKPFVLRPYVNPIGGAPPAEPRAIRFRPQALPAGIARIRSSH